ncbi:TonB-dependent receptor [soil metagenome]
MAASRQARYKLRHETEPKRRSMIPIDPPQPPPAAASAAVSEVVIRSARLPPSAADAAFSVVRIAPEALRERARLDEALQTAPGASLFRRTTSFGANPTTQGVSLRAIAGSGASRALVTLDGVPQNDPFGGWVIWSALPSEAIGSASLVRGAGAGPYGSGARIGVVSRRGVDSVPGGAASTIAGVSLGDVRASASASGSSHGVQAVGVGAFEASYGWTPVRSPRRGAADVPLAFRSRTGALTLTTDVGDAAAAFHLSGYDEQRSAGLVGANSRASGAQASATLAAQPTAERLGWRLQAWVLTSDLVNRSVSTALDRSTTTPANDQYATPATGWGLNAAVRTGGADRSLEIGADVRGSDGESRERFRYLAGAFTRNRAAGGAELVGGLYAEGQVKRGPWLLAVGARADGFSTYDAHRTERDAVTGATTLDLRQNGRSGVVPTGRVGLRREVSAVEGGFLRAAAYSGFRVPTLNELHRPFRVGNDITEANAGLKPERLYGAEFGGGIERGRSSLTAAVFANRLDDAITNVTQRAGPFTDPVAGLIPAGGVLRKRMNAGKVDAYGLEADARTVIGAVELSSALAYTVARADGGDVAPQLTGLRPAQTPRVTATSAVRWAASEHLHMSGDLRYESARFDDDQNIRRLAPGLTLNARAEWRFAPRLALAVAIDNLTDIGVQTGRTADGVVSYAPPRTVRFELRAGL